MKSSEKKKQSDRQYYLEHRDKIIARVKIYQQENKEKHVLQVKEWQKRNYKHVKNKYLNTNYNITLDDFNKMLLEQNNCCAICNTEFTKTPHVDHDHVKGTVRQLLCTYCNTGLGNFKEDQSLLNKAIMYLQKF
jgi:hypothetical protein